MNDGFRWYFKYIKHRVVESRGPLRLSIWYVYERLPLGPLFCYVAPSYVTDQPLLNPRLEMDGRWRERLDDWMEHRQRLPFRSESL